MLGMWDVEDVRCWGCGMFRIWDVWNMGCSRCEILWTWDVEWDVECWDRG